MPEVSSNPRGNQIRGDASASSANSAFASKAILDENLLCNSVYSPNLRASALKTPAPRLHPLSTKTIQTTSYISASFRNFRAQCQSANPPRNQSAWRPSLVTELSRRPSLCPQSFMSSISPTSAPISASLRLCVESEYPPNHYNPNHFQEISFVPLNSLHPEYNRYTQPPRTARSVSGPRSH